MIGDHYTCACCGEDQVKTRSEEECEEEYEYLFDDPYNDHVTVCDRCFKHLTLAALVEAPELFRPGVSLEGL